LLLPISQWWFYVWISFKEWNVTLNLRPGGAIRGKWRILDGKAREWCVLIFGAPKVVGPT
jgi:hypothetical protein